MDKITDFFKKQQKKIFIVLGVIIVFLFVKKFIKR